MSEYLLSLYRPVADGLLALHGLSVPESTRDNLATDIMLSREVVAEPKGGIHSSAPVLRAVATHARALLGYAVKPPFRTASIAARCEKLSAALNDPRAALAIGIAMPDLDQEGLLADLADNQVKPEVLTDLLAVIVEIDERREGAGRPWSVTKAIVNGACITWRRAGRLETFSWNRGALSGPFPDFLRDLIACCNGTHALVQTVWLWPGVSLRKRGDGMHPTGAALRALILDCKKADLF